MLFPIEEYAAVQNDGNEELFLWNGWTKNDVEP